MNFDAEILSNPQTGRLLLRYLKNVLLKNKRLDHNLSLDSSPLLKWNVRNVFFSKFIYISCSLSIETEEVTKGINICHDEKDTMTKQVLFYLIRTIKSSNAKTYIFW